MIVIPVFSVNLAQTRITCIRDRERERVLTEQLSRLGQPGGISVRDCLKCKLKWEGPGHCRWSHCLSRGPWTVMKEETETKQAGLPALISLLLMADVVWLPASSSCLLFLCCDGLGADAGIWVNLSALSSFFPACFIPATEMEREHWSFPDFIEKKGVSRNVFSGTQILKGASLSPGHFSDARQMNSKKSEPGISQGLLSQLLLGLLVTYRQKRFRYSVIKF